jgi:hypothetical protein
MAPRTVSAGSMHFAIIKRDGSVWTWGVNEEGQLGNGTWSGSLIPTRVIGLSNIVAMLAPESSYYNLALDSSGVVWSWGMGWDGELGRADGRYEDENQAAPVPGLSNIVAIAGGWDHSMALKSDGTIWTWGNNWAGQLGDGTTVQRDYAAPVIGLTNAIAIGSGGDHSLVLCADGTVWAWGFNRNGQVGNGNDANQLQPVPVPALTNVIALVGGYTYSLALLSDGSLMAWGNNRYGQLGNGTYEDSLTPTAVPGLSNIVAIAAGDYHSMALDNQGTLFLWGKGSWGQLGNGSQLSIPAPFLLNSISNVVALAGGQDSSIASTVDGKIYVWGLYGCLDECDLRKRSAPIAYDLDNLLDTDGDGLPDWLETGIGSDPNNPDSDYDGRTDSQELADGTDSRDANSVRQVLLGSWQFDVADWTGDQGQSAMGCSNVDRVPDWSGCALRVPGNIPAGLSYHESDGTGSDMKFNINFRSGSIVFWYKPEWSSAGVGGNGPGTGGVLFGSGNLPSDFWSMVVDAGGSNLDFRCVKDGQSQTFLTSPVSFTSNQWVQIALTYSTNSSALYIDGQLLRTGDGISVYPDASFRKLFGFNIGSSFSGQNQANGHFDQLAIYNYPLTTDDIYWNYFRAVYPLPQNVQLPELLVNSNQVTVTIGGIPLSTLAFLVNSTDFSSVPWNTFSAGTNISATFSLPPGDGAYTVAIGYILGNRTNVITRTVTVDTTPPVLLPPSQTMITTNGLLQLVGTGSEPLAHIQFDVVNAVRTNMSRTGYIMQTRLDSVSGRETTNEFQCFDILLAPGTNFITVHAMDSAGNTASNLYVYVLDIAGRTSPPVIAVQWPQNDAKISGANFTVYGQLDDPASGIKLITIVSGVTNMMEGSVGRDGHFWIQNVPSPDDTGQYLLIARDVAGNISSVVKTVSQSAVTLTINPVNSAVLSQTTTDVSGRINALDYSVSVNGVNATVTSDGEGGCVWTANVLVPAEGSLLINVSATRQGSDTPDAETMQMVDKASAVQVLSYNEQLNGQSFGSLVCEFSAAESKGDRTWMNGSGGAVHAYRAQQSTNVCTPPTSSIISASLYFNWTASWPPTTTDITTAGDTDLVDFSYYYTIPLEHCEEWGSGPPCSDLPTDDVLAHGCNYFCRKADTRMQLTVGGKGILGQSQLVRLTASATANDGMGGSIPAEHILINGQKLTPSDNGFGISFQSFPAGTNVDVTPRIVNYDTRSYSFTVTATNVNFQLAADNNRDGDITFDNADQTSADNPYRFWVNNDNDGYDGSIDDYADLDPSKASDAGNLTISCTRDLEDYTRLWIDTKDIAGDLLSGKLLLALEWKDATDDPRLQFFRPAETNGGALYLTDTNVAVQQVSVYGTHVIEWAHRNILSKYNPFIFPTSFWSAENVSADQPVAHLLFDAVGRGSGQLVLSIYKNDGITKLAESPPVYLKLQDMKEMYERWTVDNGNGEPAEMANLVTTPYAYDSAIPAENNYILFVHGWNLAPWEREAFAETAFKRLYWQGYKGRFGAFQWPTLHGFGSWKTVVTDPDHFDNSELTAWKSGESLTILLGNLNNSYPDHVFLFAHSMGNVVAGEALRLAGSNQVVNTYVAMQAAIAAHCYDQTTDFRNVTSLFDSLTPDRYANYPTNNGACYFSDIGGAGSFINFYNPNDWALEADHWQLDQDFKPDVGFSWDGTHFFNEGVEIDFSTSTYKIFAYCDEARCYALGAQADVVGFSKQTDLRSIWPPDHFGNNYKDHAWHSAEFNFDNMRQANVWKSLLGTLGFNLK